MADRTVTVRLNAAVSGYMAQMQAAGRATAAVGQQATGVAKQAGLISPKLLSIGTAAAVVGGMAVSKMANFEAALSEVRAATGETAGGMEKLRAAALKAGGDTRYSAEEAAKGITNLAKAGVSTTDILDGGLTGALDLAAAGSMDVAEAAEIAAAALVTFKLDGQDMAHVADLLAAGAGKAMGEVSDLGYALKMTGTVAAQTGLSIEETTAALAAMASRGIIGSDAGTSLKSFLQRLVPESDKAATAMEAIGLAAYDAQGNFVGLEEVARQLEAGLADLTQEQQAAALKTIFGSDAVRAAAVLYEEGADGVDTWTAAVNDAGYASEYAATLTDNLKGDLEKLTGAVDTLMASVANGTNGPLRGFVQGLTGALDAVGDARQGEGWLSWFTTSLVPVEDGADIWDKFAASVVGARRSGGGSFADEIDDTADSLLDQAAAAEEVAKELDALNKVYATAIDLQLSASAAAMNLEEAVDDLYAAVKQNGRGLDINTEKGRENKRALDDLLAASAAMVTQMLEAGESQEDVAAKADTMADRVYRAARAAGMGEDAARDYADQLRNVPTKVDTAYSATGASGAAQAARDVESAIRGIPAEKKITLRMLRLIETSGVTGGGDADGGMGGDGGGGHGLLSATRGVGSPGAVFMQAGPYWSWQRNSRGIGLHDGADIKAPAGTRVYAPNSGRLVRRMTGGWHGNAVVWSRGAGERITYAHLSSFGGSTPGGVIGRVGATGNATGPHLHIQMMRGGAYVNPARYLAAGGRVTGPGTGTSDSVPHMLSNGEWVVRASAARRYGDDFMRDLNAGTLNVRRSSASEPPAGIQMNGWTLVTPDPRQAAQTIADRQIEAAYRRGVDI